MRERLKYRICKFIVLQILFLPLSIYSQNESEIYEENLKQSFVFIENKGQIIDQKNDPNPAVLYLLNTPGFNVQLRASGWSYDMYSVGSRQSAVGSRQSAVSSWQSKDSSHDSNINYHRIDINLVDANPDCQLIPSEPLPDYFNYFTASTCSEGIKNVRQYSKITYKNIYPGIDLEFFTNKEHGYKYNFVIHPGADINDIRLRIEGPEYISLIRDTLKFGTRFGDIEELIPESYYMVNDSRVDIQARFKKMNEVYGFSVNKTIPSNSILVIDPTPKRLWGTYYGGSNYDQVGQCATDKAGNVFLYGMTNSLDNIASTGSYQGTFAGYYDCFLAKFDAAGQRQWGTYFGGTDYDQGSNTKGVGIAVDKSGNIYFTGNTESTSGIASPGAHQTVFGGGQDSFIEKFNQAGYRL